VRSKPAPNSAFFRQCDADRDWLEEILLGAATGENQQRGPIVQDAKWLHEVEDDRFLALVVGVQKADVGVEVGPKESHFLRHKT